MLQVCIQISPSTLEVYPIFYKGSLPMIALLKNTTTRSNSRMQIIQSKLNMCKSLIMLIKNYNNVYSSQAFQILTSTATFCSNFDVSASLQKLIHYIYMTASGSKVKRSSPWRFRPCGWLIYIGSCINQPLHLYTQRQVEQPNISIMEEP